MSLGFYEYPNNKLIKGFIFYKKDNERGYFLNLHAELSNSISKNNITIYLCINNIKYSLLNLNKQYLKATPTLSSTFDLQITNLEKITDISSFNETVSVVLQYKDISSKVSKIHELFVNSNTESIYKNKKAIKLNKEKFNLIKIYINGKKYTKNVLENSFKKTTIQDNSKKNNTFINQRYKKAQNIICENIDNTKITSDTCKEISNTKVTNDIYEEITSTELTNHDYEINPKITQKYLFPELVEHCSNSNKELIKFIEANSIKDKPISKKIKNSNIYLYNLNNKIDISKIHSSNEILIKLYAFLITFKDYIETQETVPLCISMDETTNEIKDLRITLLDDKKTLNLNSLKGFSYKKCSPNSKKGYWIFKLM